MDMKEKLGGGDLRSIGKANQIVDEVSNQGDFDALFNHLYDNDRLVVMRAADAIEKVTLSHPEYLLSHKDKVISFCLQATNIEFKWHLALLVSRLPLSPEEEKNMFELLKQWAGNPKESKIVRVNAIQSLFTLSERNNALKSELLSLVELLEAENVPSICARLRKLKNSL